MFSISTHCLFRQPRFLWAFSRSAGTALIGCSLQLFLQAGTSQGYDLSLQRYLAEEYAAAIQSISVTHEQIIVSGNTGGSGQPLVLAETPMDREHDDQQRFEFVTPIQTDATGHFEITLERRRKRHGSLYDRLTSRWQLAESVENTLQPRSHARYADQIACRSPKLPAAQPKNKKGLGAWHPDRFPGDIEALGIGSVTVNILPHTLIRLTPGLGTSPFSWQGRTYYVHDATVNAIDRTLSIASAHQLMVSAIILIGNPSRVQSPTLKILGHPDATPEGIYAMPNVTSEEGLALYGGILNFMAERWSRADGRHGRVHHWIMHNEVDAGYEWTNCGEKSAFEYMDLLQRSLRLMHLIIRQYDPHAQTFISLTHHWATPGNKRWYGSKKMLDLLSTFCHAEGDFAWSVAFHAYPQSLWKPRTWEDDQAVFHFNTPKITPKNIGVLDAYLQQPEFLHAGSSRTIHFSENGFNSPDYSPTALADQAAGMAYAWKKMQQLPHATVWHYHNWADNHHEGGLRLGLRKFPDDPIDPHGRKPIWELYGALGTSKEESATAESLKHIGATSWEALLGNDQGKHHNKRLDRGKTAPAAR